MDFFQHQDDARRKTGRLVVYFGLAVIGIVLSVYFVFLLALSMLGGNDPSSPNPYAESPFHPDLFGIVAIGTIAVIVMGSLYKTAQLSSGGESVALMLGGRLINPNTRDLAEKRLLNVVEEMSLASGTPVPPVYVMDNEPSINAFAAGHNVDDAVIGVSKGSLDYLDRDELQGVIAHEFSHILNGDMHLNLRLIGILHGILIIALLGWFVMRSIRFSGGSSRSDGKGGGGALAILAIGLGLLIIGGIGLFFGKLIKSAVSRQREYLADASAVQFTRLPDGIAGALKKIGGRPDTSKIEDPHAEEISHMFFGNAFGSFSSRMFSTHPPLNERIRRIDPSFDGKFPKRVERVRITSAATETRKKKVRPKRDPFAAVGQAGGSMPMDPTGVLGTIGIPGMEQLVYAAAILESMPQPIRDATAEPYGARAVIYALLLDRDEKMRRHQLDVLRPLAEELSFKETQRIVAITDGLPTEAQLPLVEMAMPALKALSPDQYARFRKNVAELVAADGKIDLLEYTVQKTLLKTLDVHFRLARPTSVRYRRIDRVLSPLSLVLSMLAYAGQENEADARRAFDAGMSEIGQKGSPAAKGDCSLKNLDAALNQLSASSAAVKKDILRACVACVAADGKVEPREGELVQAVAAVLGVPVPPVGASAGA